jgi:cobalamin biosynthesis Mg chelatase CobN
MCRDPEDKQIQRELRALKGLIKEEKAASAKVFKGAFGAAPKPKSNGTDSSSSSRSVAAAAAAGGAVDTEISEDAADSVQPGKASAAPEGRRGGSRSSYLKALLAVAVLFLAIVALLFGWLPGVSR